jgi:hypothetical protein
MSTSPIRRIASSIVAPRLIDPTQGEVKRQKGQPKAKPSCNPGFPCSIRMAIAVPLSNCMDGRICEPADGWHAPCFTSGRHVWAAHPHRSRCLADSVLARSLSCRAGPHLNVTKLLDGVDMISTDLFDTLLLRTLRSERARILAGERAFARELSGTGPARRRVLACRGAPGGAAASPIGRSTS